MRNLREVFCSLKNALQKQNYMLNPIYGWKGDQKIALQSKGWFLTSEETPSIETANFDEEKKRPSKANLHVNSHRIKKNMPKKKNALQSQSQKSAFLTGKKPPFKSKGRFWRGKNDLQSKGWFFGLLFPPLWDFTCYFVFEGRFLTNKKNPFNLKGNF